MESGMENIVDKTVLASIKGHSTGDKSIWSFALAVFFQNYYDTHKETAFDEMKRIVEENIKIKNKDENQFDYDILSPENLDKMVYKYGWSIWELPKESLEHALDKLAEEFDLSEQLQERMSNNTRNTHNTEYIENEIKYEEENIIPEAKKNWNYDSITDPIAKRDAGYQIFDKLKTLKKYKAMVEEDDKILSKIETLKEMLPDDAEPKPKLPNKKWRPRPQKKPKTESQKEKKKVHSTKPQEKPQETKPTKPQKKIVIVRKKT